MSRDHTDVYWKLEWNSAKTFSKKIFKLILTTSKWKCVPINCFLYLEQKHPISCESHQEKRHFVEGHFICDSRKRFHSSWDLDWRSCAGSAPLFCPLAWELEGNPLLSLAIAHLRHLLLDGVDPRGQHLPTLIYFFNHRLYQCGFGQI